MTETGSQPPPDTGPQPDTYLVRLIAARDWSDDTVVAKAKFPDKPLDTAIRLLIEEELEQAIEAQVIVGKIKVDRILPPAMPELDNPEMARFIEKHVQLCRDILVSTNVIDSKVRERAYKELMELYRQFPKFVARRPIKLSGNSMATISVRDDEIVRDFIVAGKKIQAIKVLRACLSVGLKEAKDAIEDPDNFQQV